MQQYLDLLRDARMCHPVENRTGVDAGGFFGRQMRFDLGAGFPLVTTKRMPFRLVAVELLWFLSGDTNIGALQEQGCRIWDEWADERGDLGPVYGSQWRSWGDASGDGVDQIGRVVHELRTNPHSRRHIVSAWNVSDLPDMALPPCHMMFQFHVDARRRLSCHLYQRSCDMFLGVPFNIASYALLTHMVAQVCGLEVGDFVHTLGDGHVYVNHHEAVDVQLRRKPLPLPQLRLNPHITDIDAFTLDDFELLNYQAHGKLTAAVAV